jgi:hypothetical protein
MLVVIKVLVIILLVILCLILGLLLGLVLFPFHFEGALKKNKEYEALVDVNWLWGVFGLEFVLLPKGKFISLKLFKVKFFTSKVKTKAPEKKKEQALKKAEKKAKRKEKKRNKKQPLDKQIEQIMTTSQRFSVETLKDAVVFLLRIFSSLKFKISGKFEIGFADPANTGMFLGFFYAIEEVLRMKDFKLYPNWEEQKYEGSITVFIRVWLADILIIALKFMFKSSIRKIWWPKVKERIKFWGKVKPQVAKQ